MGAIKIAIDVKKARVKCEVYSIDFWENKRKRVDRTVIDNEFLCSLIAGAKKKRHGCKIEGKDLICERELDADYVISFSVSVEMIFPMLCCLPAYNMNLHQLYTLTHELYSRVSSIDEGMSWKRFVHDTLSDEIAQKSSD